MTFDDSLDRDPQLVRQDVVDVCVTIQSAALDYGVVVGRRTLKIDVTTTGICRPKP